MAVRVRFAPSPTGRLHVGNIYIALHNWLYARKAGGEFLLRLDDTDRERSTEDFANGIKADLEWLGLSWNLFDRQSVRLAIYDAAADKLRAAGRLYPCYESAEELSLKRKVQLGQGKPPIYDRAALKLTDADRARLEAEGVKAHWRFKLEPRDVTWADLVRGSAACRRDQPVRPGAGARERQLSLHLHLGGGRHRVRHHAGDPRQRPRHQHRDADPDLRGAGRQGARHSRICRCWWTRRARGCRSASARSPSARCARTGWSRWRSTPTWRGSAPAIRWRRCARSAI